MAKPCRNPPTSADGDRGEGREIPAVAGRLLACADGEAVGDAALRDRRGDEAGKGDQRADREVDAGGQDDEGHADREQAVDRDLAQDVEEVERREEARLGDREARHQHDQEDERREAGQEADDVDLGGGCASEARVLSHRLLPALHAAFALSVIIDIRISSLASSRMISPVTRPSRMVTMRSLIASTSGSSEEMAITAMPERAISKRRLCTSTLAPTSMPRVGSSTISTFGRKRQPAGEHDLLLIAAGKIGDESAPGSPCGC